MAKRSGYLRTVVPVDGWGAGEERVIALGTIGKEWETKYTTSGKLVATSSLAVNIYNRETRATDTTWLNLVAWEKKAEILAQWAGKGKPVLLELKHQVRTFTKRDNTEGTAEEYVVQELVLLKDESGTASAPTTPILTEEEAAIGVPLADGGDLFDDDLPF